MLDFTRGKLKNQTGEQSNATLLSHLSFFKTRFSNHIYIYIIYVCSMLFSHLEQQFVDSGIIIQFWMESCH